jgi:hypothetical protein
MKKKKNQINRSLIFFKKLINNLRKSLLKMKSKLKKKKKAGGKINKESIVKTTRK